VVALPLPAPEEWTLVSGHASDLTPSNITGTVLRYLKGMRVYRLQISFEEKARLLLITSVWLYGIEYTPTLAHAWVILWFLCHQLRLLNFITV
jgi:hypothetical protein